MSKAILYLSFFFFKNPVLCCAVSDYSHVYVHSAYSRTNQHNLLPGIHGTVPKYKIITKEPTSMVPAPTSFSH